MYDQGTHMTPHDPLDLDWQQPKVSRQLIYQRRRHKRGLCVICGKPCAKGDSRWFCLKHLVAQRKYVKKAKLKHRMKLVKVKVFEWLKAKGI